MLKTDYVGGQKWPREYKKKIAIGGQIVIIGSHGRDGLDKIHGLISYLLNSTFKLYTYIELPNLSIEFNPFTTGS